MSDRRLVIVRHAKAEPYTGSDHSRALTAGGARAAASVGRWLAETGVVPDYALVSSATRTRQTWSGITAAFDGEIHTEFSDDLYGAGPEDVIDAVRWVPVDAKTVVYVGHNPTAGELPHLLDDGTGDHALLAQIAMSYPTAAVAVLEVERPWSELSMGSARLEAFFVGDRG
ncbi:MAG: SixA phosphatase family protein [Marmoricola sp.]